MLLRTLKNNTKTFPVIRSLSLLGIMSVLGACAMTGEQQANAPAPQEDVVASIETEGTGPATVDTATSELTEETAPDALPQHIPAGVDAAMPWWAIAARWDAEQADERTWSAAQASLPQQPYSANNHTELNPFESEQVMLPDSLDDQVGETETIAPADLWQRLRDGFQLGGNEQHRRVRPYIDWYAGHQAYLDRVAERASPFLYDIVEAVAERGMPMEIALLPVVESAFQPFAYSPGRAAGIWQFIPGTGKRYGLKQNWWYDGRRDVPRATEAALDYLSHLHKRFDGDWLLALAAYNSGEGRVHRAVKKNRAKGRGIDFWSLDLPTETEGYVPKLLAISAIVADTVRHGVTLATIPDEPALEQVSIGSQIDLALAAELADMPIEDIYRLNPAFNRWATDPKGPHVLSLPIDKAEPFRTALASIDKEKRIRWHRHRIRQGETLGHIARKFQTTVNLLQEVNNIRDKWIRAGDSIIIPVATKNLKHYLSEDQRRLALQNTQRRGIKVRHTVRKGDTLWDLSRQFDVKVSQLASWNGMSPRDSLKPGQKLVIWAPNRKVANNRYAAPPGSDTRQRLHYRVRKGDSLSRIAQKFRVTVAKLRRWNSLPKGKYLQPGQRLTLFVDVTQQS
jgi:membrane-bound lytic murein transglycosylase D